MTTETLQKANMLAHHIDFLKKEIGFINGSGGLIITAKKEIYKPGAPEVYIDLDVNPDLRNYIVRGLEDELHNYENKLAEL